jgi:hypothetical protein
VWQKGALGDRLPVQAEEGSGVCGSGGRVADAHNRHTADRVTADAGDRRSNTVDMAAHVVHLREEKVFLQLGGKEEHDSKSWICDTGAMNVRVPGCLHRARRGSVRHCPLRR